MPKLKTILFIQLANLIPFLGLLGFISIFFWSSGNLLEQTGLALVWCYLLPPILYRIWTAMRGKPEGAFDINSKEYFTWWVGAQLQAHYLRLPFLEEILRMIPMAYSLWLRCWGARIGKAVYWSPQSIVLDRGYLNIGDFVVVGFGVRFTAHLVGINKQSNYELYLKPCLIGNFSLLGGYCGIGPGAYVGEKEMVPSHVLLTPDSGWVQGEKRSKA